MSRATVEGIIVPGHGVASGTSAKSPFPEGTIVMQTPFFAAGGLDLSSLHPATMNVDIAPSSYAVRQAPWTFHDVEWTDVHGAESFSFFTCGLTVVGGDGTRHEGFVYYPHPDTKPMNEQAPTVLEVLMPRVDDIAYGVRVSLDLDPDEVEVLRDT